MYLYWYKDLCLCGEAELLPYYQLWMKVSMPLLQPLFALHYYSSHQGVAFCYLNRLREEHGIFQVLNRSAIFKAAQNLLGVGMRRDGIKNVGGMVLFWKQGNPNIINISEESKSFLHLGFSQVGWGNAFFHLINT